MITDDVMEHALCRIARLVDGGWLGVGEHLADERLKISRIT